MYVSYKFLKVKLLVSGSFKYVIINDLKRSFIFNFVYVRVWECTHKNRCLQRPEEGGSSLVARVTRGCDLPEGELLIWVLETELWSSARAVWFLTNGHFLNILFLFNCVYVRVCVCVGVSVCGYAPMNECRKTLLGKEGFFETP